MSAQPKRGGWTPPAWLGPTPFPIFSTYGKDAELAWYSDSDQALARCPTLLVIYKRESLYDTHTNALRGSRADIRLMKRFYTNLATLRLIR